jgi:tellurite resistance protein TerC
MLPAAIAWAAFLAAIAALLAIDLFVLHRRARAERRRDAALWSAFWIGLALLFNLGVYLLAGSTSGLQWTTGYLLEKALSVDNVFLFLLIFASFAVPVAEQRRVLFWGVAGAIVMRAALILLGGALLSRFELVFALFGVVLIVSGLRFLRREREAQPPERQPLVRLVRRIVPTTSGYEGGRFFVRRGGAWYATPLALVLVLIEGTDLLFAVDSIPAVYAVTDDPFIVLTSNVFAILGLRSLFLLVRSSLAALVYLRPALAAILSFVGAKMLLHDVVAVPAITSLFVIAAILSLAVGASLLRRPQEAGAPQRAVSSTERL